MLINRQGSSGKIVNQLSDQAKKRTGLRQAATPVQTNQPIAATPTGMATPNANLQSPSIPGTVNAAGKQTQIPTQSSGKSGGFNRGPVSPPPITPTPSAPILGIQPQPIQGDVRKINMPVAPTVGRPVAGDHGTLIRQEANMPENIRSKAGHDVWAEAWKSGKTKLGQDEYLNSIGWYAANPVSNFTGGQKMGQPMTLRDAYSTLQSAGYGSF